VLELGGLTVVFLVANLALGVAVVLSMRALSLPFVSIYVLDDASLVVLSALQGAIFGWWRWTTPGMAARRSPGLDDAPDGPSDRTARVAPGARRSS
jgi:hypothetical protein